VNFIQIKTGIFNGRIIINKKIRFIVILSILLLSLIFIIVESRGNDINLINIKPGDIIVTCSIQTPVPGYWHHTSIYIGNGNAVGSFYGGVIIYPIEAIKKKSEVMILRVNTSDDIKEKAVEFSKSKVGYPFNWLWLEKTQGDSYYCSELVWAAYYNASDGKINLDSIDSMVNTPIYPDNIANSKYVEKISHDGSYCIFPLAIESIIHVYENCC
jgi:uncharacterized protein YycO